jgi:ribosomal protein S6
MITGETALLGADVDVGTTIEGVADPRIYEIGYHIIPTIKEEDVEKIVGNIRSIIEKAGGSFITEGAPSLIKLAYPMSVREGEKYTEYDRGYFGWIKFEAPASIVAVLNNALKINPSILRFVIWRTVREDTRAKIKPPAMREVKRTDTIKSAPRRSHAEESSAPVSEADLEKALKDITTE